MRQLLWLSVVKKGIAKVREILGGGADAALECVGTAAAVDQALGVLHNGGRLGFVGVPHYNNRALGSTFAQNISVAGGAASVTTYDKQVLAQSGTLMATSTQVASLLIAINLDEIDQAYKDMDERKTIKGYDCTGLTKNSQSDSENFLVRVI